MWFKAIFAAIAVVFPLLVVFGCWLTCTARQVTQGAVSRSADIACSLNSDQRDERRQRFAALRAGASEVTELENGYILHFKFDDRTLRDAASLVADESSCCSFLDFQLTVQPSRGRFLVEITGPEGTKEFLASNVKLDTSQVESAVTTSSGPGTLGCECPAPAACKVESCGPAPQPRRPQ
jgi:hypothetical protein